MEGWETKAEQRGKGQESEEGGEEGRERNTPFCL